MVECKLLKVRDYFLYYSKSGKIIAWPLVDSQLDIVDCVNTVMKGGIKNHFQICELRNWMDKGTICELWKPSEGYITEKLGVVNKLFEIM